MALRRFPWKLPRTSDVSYRYFVAEPTPGTPTVESLKRRPSANDDSSSTHTNQHGHHHDSGHASVESSAASTAASTAPSMQRTETPPSNQTTQQSNQTLRGPWRLLRLLPRESRFSIGRVLDTDPNTRATMEEIKVEPWIAQRQCCSQDESGQVHRIPGHDHVLEPPSGSGGGGGEKK